MPDQVDPPSEDVSAGHPSVTRTAPPALEADTVRLVLVGQALFAVAFVVLLFVHRDADWLWACVAGVVLGVPGLVMARRARR